MSLMTMEGCALGIRPETIPLMRSTEDILEGNFGDAMLHMAEGMFAQQHPDLYRDLMIQLAVVNYDSLKNTRNHMAAEGIY